MAFQLNGVVPWGRSLEEYRKMFQLSEHDLTKRIAGFGDGPASFNCEAAELGCSVTSFDPIYRFSREQLRARIDETCGTVMEQMRENLDHYVWTDIPGLDELKRLRMSAMARFLADYERGRAEGRYVCHSLPDRLPVEDGSFDLGLSSHFLLMYTGLGLDFHVRAISEMLRVCGEVRIFPIVDLDGKRTGLTEQVAGHFQGDYQVEIRQTEYEFQKGGNRLLVIRASGAARACNP